MPHSMHCRRVTGFNVDSWNPHKQSHTFVLTSKYVAETEVMLLRAATTCRSTCTTHLQFLTLCFSCSAAEHVTCIHSCVPGYRQYTCWMAEFTKETDSSSVARLAGGSARARGVLPIGARLKIKNSVSPAATSCVRNGHKQSSHTWPDIIQHTHDWH